MPKDIIITPASGLVDFQGNTGISSATIQLDDSGNLNIANPGGDLTLGDTSRDIFIGNGVDNVDIVFEQDGAIRGLTNKTVSLGQIDSYIKVVGGLKDSSNNVGTATSVLLSTGSGVKWEAIATAALQGPQGATGPSTAINATNTTDDVTYFPVFIAAAGSNQTPRIRTTATAFSFNASTSKLAIGGDFKLDGDIFAANDTRGLRVEGVTSAVNYLDIINSATGQPTKITTNGTDTNINLEITTKGAGAVTIDTGTGAGQIDLKPGSSNVRIWDDDSSHYYQFATGNRTANYTVTLPAASFTFAGINIAQTFSSAQTFSNANAITLSNATAGVIRFNSTATRTANLFVDATASGNTKTINLGTGGAAGSTTNINIGATAGTSTVNVNGDLIASGTVTASSFSGPITIPVGTSAPTSPSAGNLWYNNELGRTFIYYEDVDSAQWVDAAPFNVDLSQLGDLQLTNLSVSDSTSLDSLVVSGVVTATSFNATSDFNLKENIQTFDNPLNIIKNIRGVRFEWKNNNKPSIGVIAQEIEKILPELVTDTDPKTVNYNGLIGVMIEAIKEQQTQINNLTKQIENLKNER